MPSSESRAASTGAVPDAVRRPLLACARGDLPPNVALVQLFMTAGDDTQAEIALAETTRQIEQTHASGADRLRAVRRLWDTTPGAFETVRLVLCSHDRPRQAAEPAVAHWADIFDRAAAISPEAGVALYSLGRPDLLHAITAEVAAWIHDRGLLGRERTALEIGCGTGRFLPVLAPALRFVIGIDISNIMLTQARASCGYLPNSALVHTSGRDLATFADNAFDLVYAVDAFPYLVASGFAAPHFEEAARVLRPGGTLLICNYSYRGDVTADAEDVQHLGRAAGLALLSQGARPFTLWDGTTFQLQKIEP
ncbi:MAG TPA: class I SAM-dependent methyltransferase [Xanthobacteraceae bacterium]|nr:class I SAM-dependent methyltransferase [Xanthobacteraceae bacterium]